MNAFFVAFDTSLSTAQLAARRRELAKSLRQRDIELQTLKVGKDLQPVLTRLVKDGKATPVVAIDDRCPLPNKAEWLADLTRDVIGLPALSRPQVVYVTQRASAAGDVQARKHAVVRRYVKRDQKGAWVSDVVEAVLSLVEQLRVAPAKTEPPPPLAGPEIIGTSPCFRAAIEDLDHVMQSPYGLVTGQPGVGKMFLIRAMWREMTSKSRVFVLPCGSFFKDWYVGGRRRTIGPGREAVAELTPLLKEAHCGLLVLHQIDRLPTALQEELAVRLSDSAGGPPGFPRWLGVDPSGLVEYDVKILATSTFRPEELELKGRIIPELLTTLRKRHVRIPTLAERGPDDVRLLCEDVVARISARLELPVASTLEPAAAEILAQARWPGNLSDLVRVLEHAVWQSHGGPITPKHLPDGLETTRPRRAYPTLKDVVAEAKRTAIQNALEHTGGDMPDAAKLLGCNVKGLYRLMKTLGMPVRRTK